MLGPSVLCLTCRVAILEQIDPHNETAYSQKAQISLSIASSIEEMEGALAIFDQVNQLVLFCW